jgi:hypothetical protein
MGLVISVDSLSRQATAERIARGGDASRSRAACVVTAKAAL